MPPSTELTSTRTRALEQRPVRYGNPWVIATKVFPGQRTHGRHDGAKHGHEPR